MTLTVLAQPLRTFARPRAAPRRLPGLGLGLLLGLAGCAGAPPKWKLPDPPVRTAAEAPADAQARLGAAEQGADSRRASPLPAPPAGAPALRQASELPRPERLPPGPMQLNLRDLPLPDFVNYVFGDLLRLSFQMDQAVSNLKPVVTLRLSEPTDGGSVFDAALQVLAQYGVGVRLDGDLLRVALTSDPALQQAPLIFTGEALPDIPSTHRPVFHLVQLKAVANTTMLGWLKAAFAGIKIDLTENAERNSILLRGAPALVAQAAAAARELDQPLLRGRHALRFQPRFREAASLAGEMVEVLKAQGVHASTSSTLGAVIVLPIKSINSLLIFAADATWRDHALALAESLDLQPQDSGGGTSWFSYAVRNTAAGSVADVLGQLLGDAPAPAAAPAEAMGAAGSATAARRAPASRARAGGRVVVDESRNLLFFAGTHSEWLNLRGLIEQLDQPARMVLVEVTIAEVTLSDESRLGVEWALSQISLGGLSGGLTFQDGDSFGLPTAGLTWAPISSSGQTRALLNAFAQSDRVSILSSPRILVRSGEEATIDVGTEIPVITQTAALPGADAGGGNLVSLQQVQMRKTGVRLNVKPIVHADARVDLEVRQEVSEALPNQSSGIDSPAIFERTIGTHLSLRDGGAVLLGGLISESRSRGGSKLPGLGDLPLLGRLFRVEGDKASRTELLVLIVPYIIRDENEAEEVSRLLREQLQLLH